MQIIDIVSGGAADDGDDSDGDPAALAIGPATRDDQALRAALIAAGHPAVTPIDAGEPAPSRTVSTQAERRSDEGAVNDHRDTGGPDRSDEELEVLTAFGRSPQDRDLLLRIARLDPEYREAVLNVLSALERTTSA